jgi:DNA-binding IclR family transcriptional regulator
MDPEILKKEILKQLANGPQKVGRMTRVIFKGVTQTNIKKMSTTVRYHLDNMVEGNIVEKDKKTKEYSLKNYIIINGALVGTREDNGEIVSMEVGRTLMITHELGTTLLMLEEIKG